MHRTTRAIVGALTISLALAIAPAVAASAHAIPTTGTVVLELTSLAGKRLTSVDSKAHIGLSAEDSSFTASSAPHKGAADYRGKIHHGAYTFTKIAAGVTFDVWATDAGGAYLPASADSFSVVAGKTLTIKLPLTKGARITGTIKNSKGKHVSGAVVALLDGPTINDPGQPIARTNSKGEFTLQGVPSGSYTLEFNTRYSALGSVTAKYGWSYWGGATEAESPVLVLNQQTDTTSATSLTRHNGVVAPGFSITGTAHFADAASTSANEVQLRSVDNYYDFTRGSMAVDGTFSVRAIAGNYDLFVLHDGNYWYYTGEGNAPSLDPGDAVPVSFDGSADLVVTMGTL